MPFEVCTELLLAPCEVVEELRVRSLLLLHVVCCTFSVCHLSVAVVGSFGGSGAGIGVRPVDRG